jgi:predicted secreted protein
MAPYLFRNICLLCCVPLILACTGNSGVPVQEKSAAKDTLLVVGCQEKINATVGKIIEIRLEAIQGTGYQWLQKGESPLLEPIQSDVLRYASPDANEEMPMPGRKGFQILEFKAVKKGEGQIQLEYSRTFEKGIEKTCTMKIVVE